MTNKKNYIVSLFSGLFANFVTQILGVLSIPILVSYFGNEKFGVLTVLNSLMAFFIIANFGVAEAATILISKDSSLKNKLLVLKRAIYISILVVIMLVVLLLVTQRIDYSLLLFGRIADELKYDVDKSLMVFVIIFLFTSTLSLLDSFTIGLQKLYLVKFFDTAFAILLFIATLYIVYFLHGELWHYFLAVGVIKLVLYIIKSLVLFKYLFLSQSESSVSSNFDPYNYKEIVVLSAKTFTLSIITAVVWSTDNILISNMLGVGEVANYAITFKLFQVLFSFTAIFATAIVPIFSKNFGLDNWFWINQNYQAIILLLSVLGGLSWIGGVYFAPFILEAWLGSKINYSLATIFFLSAYSYLISIINLNAILVMSFNYLKQVIWLGVAEAVSNLIFSIAFIKLLNSSDGAAIGTFIAALIFPFFMLIFVFPKLTEYKISPQYSAVFTFLLKFILPHIALYLVLVNLIRHDSLVIFIVGVMVTLFYIYMSLNYLFKVFIAEYRSQSFFKNLKALRASFYDRLN